jgi:hypothetical protein
VRDEFDDLLGGDATEDGSDRVNLGTAKTATN